MDKAVSMIYNEIKFSESQFIKGEQKCFLHEKKSLHLSKNC